MGKLGQRMKENEVVLIRFCRVISTKIGLVKVCLLALKRLTHLSLVANEAYSIVLISRRPASWRGCDGIFNARILFQYFKMGECGKTCIVEHIYLFWQGINFYCILLIIVLKGTLAFNGFLNFP